MWYVVTCINIWFFFLVNTSKYPTLQYHYNSFVLLFLKQRYKSSISGRDNIAQVRNVCLKGCNKMFNNSNYLIIWNYNQKIIQVVWFQIKFEWQKCVFIIFKKWRMDNNCIVKHVEPIV